MASSTAQMDFYNRAMCHALRNPPPGSKRTSLRQVAAMVGKTDGTHPTEGGVRAAAMQFGAEKQKRGRKEGYKKTTGRVAKATQM